MAGYASPSAPLSLPTGHAQSASPAGAKSQRDDVVVVIVVIVVVVVVVVLAAACFG
ncbi:predicted protein [Plenodomus lingam JN3]|uniref:Predicted protein n=1 Tax=Leptosphaeria maculans (strain JN3 / isolate v23.1.3 / race Av1-4-5-6-7-8) TaxID=985895 RepID=E4ZHJ7_LEPMJ|nr:predicted protein [Plenodomus lingam JN3]CBX90830.1 predicted protein [Plenodomus lingam JN3]